MSLVPKPCKKCGESDRYPSGSCRPCGRIKSRTWAANNREHCRAANQEYSVTATAKISARKKRNRDADPEHYDKGSKAASYRKWRGADVTTPPKFGECPICLRQQKLVFDHDHTTGAHRGWICNKCNLALGMVGDDSAMLRRFLCYLLAHEMRGRVVLPFGASDSHFDKQWQAGEIVPRNQESPSPARARRSRTC